MRTMCCLLLTCLVLAGMDSAAVTIALKVESDEVPIFGAVCGAIELYNETDTIYEMAAPSFDRRTLMYELEYGGNTTLVYQKTDITFLGSPKLRIDPHETIHIPFYLMKYGHEFICREIGEMQFRARIRTSINPADRGELVTDSVSIAVVNSEHASQWRDSWSVSIDILQPYSMPSAGDFLQPFSETYYGDTYELYQGHASHLVFKALSGASVDASILESISRSEDIGAQLIRIIAAGNVCSDVREVRGGQVLVVR